MITTDLMLYSLKALAKRKTRSFLTILSVLIGIAAVTVLISFGNGISSYVENISEEMGKDKLIIQPRGAGFGPPPLDTNVKLDEDDVDVVRDVFGVEEATGVYMLSGKIEYDDDVKYAYVIASDYQDHERLIKEVYALTLQEGREFNGREKTHALLGNNYKKDNKIFEKPVKLRNTITVNDHEFNVQGFYEEVGNPVDDANIYLTDHAAEEFFTPKTYQFILVRATPNTNPTLLVEKIRKDLRDHRKQTRGNEDFFVETFEQVIATFTNILNVITGVVIIIALISVFVAGVNITNTMYTSTLERTKEIGIFKAIGSRNTDILLIFVIEAGLLSLVGGLLGVTLGYVTSHIAGTIIANAGYPVFTPLFTWTLAVTSLLFSFLVGALSGILPAYKASKLKPVDALRYE